MNSILLIGLMMLFLGGLLITYSSFLLRKERNSLIEKVTDSTDFSVQKLPNEKVENERFSVNALIEDKEESKFLCNLLEKEIQLKDNVTYAKNSYTLNTGTLDIEKKQSRKTDINKILSLFNLGKSIKDIAVLMEIGENEAETIINLYSNK